MGEPRDSSPNQPGNLQEWKKITDFHNEISSLQPSTAVCANIRFLKLLWTVWRMMEAVIIKRGLRVTVIPPIQQADFNASLDACNAADGFGRCANTLKFGHN